MKVQLVVKEPDGDDGEWEQQQVWHGQVRPERASAVANCAHDERYGCDQTPLNQAAAVIYQCPSLSAWRVWIRRAR